MNLLFLCEQDPEAWTSWSGITKSLVDQFRSEGHSVFAGDVDLYGSDRLLAAALTCAPDRRRWGTRFHLGGAPFHLRSRRANHIVEAHRTKIDVIVQIGATFQVSDRFGIPCCLCCDSNIRVAQQGAASGYSDGSTLSPRELEEIAARERAVYAGAAAIFPLSERLRRSFIDDFGVPAGRVRAVYAGPNFDGGSVAALPAVGVEPHPPTVLFVGLQFHRKGGDVLVESFREVRRQLPDARLLLAGVREGYVSGPGIICLGELNKNTPVGAAALARAYGSADVFALPTRFEPFGIAFVEAMHFGLPCIGPRAWAVPEIIADGETGFTVPVDDVTALTDRLLRLLNDKPLARRLGEAGRERARQLFTWRRVVARMSEVMLPLVNGGHELAPRNGRRAPVIAAPRN